METYYGHVRTPADAIILFEACRIGLLPRVQRRLSEKERQSIRSGSVFVWDEREAGMRRWTDGKSWSASRVSGSFLTYREMEGKRGGSGMTHSSRAGKTPESMRGSDDDRAADTADDGPDGYRYKPDGLMKQSFSITTSAGQHLHLISYYSRSHPSAVALQQPSTDPALRHVRPQKGLYPESTVNDQQNLPVVTRGPMAATPYSITPHHVGGYPPRSAAAAAAAAAAAPPPPPSYASQFAWPPHALAPPTGAPVPYSPPYLPPISANGHVPPPPQPTAPLPPPGLPPYDRPVHHGEPTTTASATTAIPSIQPSTAPAPAPPIFASTRSPRISDIRDPTPRTPPSYIPDHHHHHRLASPRLPPAHTTALPLTPTHAPSSVVPPLHHSPTHSLSHPPYAPISSSTSSNLPRPLEYSTPASSASSTSSSATSVPSIAAMMNSAPTASSSSSSSASSAAGPLRFDPPRLGPLPRTGGHPLFLAATAADGPKDIPSEKIGFGGEDMRALRQLDRVFI